MGADLYIRSISDKAIAEYEPKFEAACAKRDALPDGPERDAVQENEVHPAYEAMYPDDGYFRDSYNSSSLFQQCNLSWWRDVIPMLDEKRLLQPTAIHTLKRMLVNSQALFEKKIEEMPDEEREYFIDKKARFERFLDKAVQLNEGIYCSL